MMTSSSPAFFCTAPPFTNHHHHHNCCISFTTFTCSSCTIHFKIPTKRTHKPLAATTIDDPSIVYTDEENEAMSKVGARVRVKAPLKVYHIPKVSEFELNGLEGEIKQFVGVWKGKRISANLPFKVQFVVDDIPGRDGPVKFFAHLKEDEFEYITG